LTALIAASLNVALVLACSGTGGGASGSPGASSSGSLGSSSGTIVGYVDGGVIEVEPDGATVEVEVDGATVQVEPDGARVFQPGGEEGGTPDVCSGGSVGGARPATVRTFTGYDCHTAAPLVVLLHDYGSTGAAVDAYFGFSQVADALGFLYVHPDGTKDSSGNQFWNATDACCNFNGATVDDSTYLFDLIEEIGSHYAVDSKRIFVAGYGNGGFMAYRLACDHGIQIAAIADLGGAMWSDSTKCGLQAPTAALEIHGTGDGTYAYDGGTTSLGAYPSAPGTASEWFAVDRCKDASAEVAPSIALLVDSGLTDDAGMDTTVMRWPVCPGRSEVDLWSMQGAGHQPALAPSFASTVLAFLFAHAK
jgi:polyhydroxybutyrate depolymerase